MFLYNKHQLVFILACACFRLGSFSEIALFYIFFQTHSSFFSFKYFFTSSDELPTCVTISSNSVGVVPNLIDQYSISCLLVILMLYLSVMKCFLLFILLS